MSKNTTQIRAAVVREKGGPFNLETLTLEAPRRDEVLVKVVATGLCHTDMVARDKGYPVPHPIVLGHEGAGIVESVGIRGILEGESVPDIFIPQLIELNAQGRFPFEKLVKFYSLDQINRAAKDSENGSRTKPIIRLSPA